MSQTSSTQVKEREFDAGVITNSPSRSDIALVRNFEQGDERAFATIFTRYHRLVYSIAYDILGSHDDAEDVVQEVFTNASVYLAREFTPQNLKAWFARVGRNDAIDRLRARKETITLTSAHEPYASGPQVQLERRHEVRELVRRLCTLSDQQRNALLLLEMGGNSYNEICDQMQIDKTSVRNLIKRARTNLRIQRSGESMDCTTVREKLTTQTDRRKIGAELRYHLSHCHSCRQESSTRTANQLFNCV